MRMIPKPQTKTIQWAWVIIALMFLLSYNLQNRYRVIEYMDMDRQIVLDRYTGELMVKNLKGL